MNNQNSICRGANPRDCQASDLKASKELALIELAAVKRQLARACVLLQGAITGGISPRLVHDIAVLLDVISKTTFKNERDKPTFPSKEPD